MNVISMEEESSHAFKQPENYINYQIVEMGQ